MYNQEQKLQFIEENSVDKVAYETQMKTTFKRTQQYEEKAKKDISKFKLSELVSFFKDQKTRSVETLFVLSNRLDQYSKWCIEKGINSKSDYHFAEIDQALLMDCVLDNDDAILTRDQLIQEMELLPNVSDKFLALGIFEGLYGKSYLDYFHLTMDSFTNEDGQWYVTVTRGKLKVSDLLYELGKESAETFDQYVVCPDDYSFKKRSYRLENKKDIIKLGFNAYKNDEKTFIRNTGRKLDYLYKYYNNSAFTLYALRESGRIHEVNKFLQKEKDLLKALTDEEIVLKYGKVNNRSLWRKKYEKYLDFGE